MLAGKWHNPFSERIDMTKVFSAIIVLSILNGCTAIPAAAIYSGSLKGMERVTGLYFAETRPDLPNMAAVRCMTNAMKRIEIVKLGSKDSRFLTPSYRAALQEVEARPNAANCLAALRETAA